MHGPAPGCRDLPPGLKRFRALLGRYQQLERNLVRLTQLAAALTAFHPAPAKASMGYEQLPGR